MLAGREISDLSREVSNINTDSYLESGVVKLAPKDTVPELKIYFPKGEYIPAPLWHHNYLYDKDFRRKQNDSEKITEDLFNPGFFSFTLKPYETFEMFVSVDEQSNLEYESLFREEKKFRRSYKPTLEQLPQVAKDISKRVEILSKKGSAVVPMHVSNYPYDDQNTREMLFSFWGLAVLEKDSKKIETNLLKYIEFLNQGHLPAEILSRQMSDKNQPADINLIFINLIYYLYRDWIDLKFIDDNVLESCRDVIEIYSKGTNRIMYQDVDGLIFSGSRSINTSWSPPTGEPDGEVRFGKLCEINALWYNSLKIMEFFSRETEKNKQAKKYAEMAELTKKSFQKEFWDPKLLRYYDCIKGDQKEKTFSISQLFLIALPFSMLDSARGILVLKQIEENLLTPLGLRSLSPKEKKYKGRLKNSINNHKSDYYVGSVWPWTIGMYTDAVLKLRGTNQVVVDRLRSLYDALGQFFYEQGSGTISEFFEGDPPHRRHGRICYSLNLTELLRGYYTLHKTMQEKQNN